MLQLGRDGERARRLWVLWILIAVVFTLVQVRQSLHGGRLALPPTFDDVGFLHDGQQRLQVLFDGGPAAALADAVQSAPHSPWSSYLAALAFLVLGPYEWAPATANGLLILGVLLWLGRRGHELRVRWLLVAGGVVLSWPLMAQAVENFRPDLAGGLATAALATQIVRQPWIGAGRRRHYLTGLGFALALLIKPTISPVTSLIVVTALAASTLTDLARGREQRWREIAKSWIRCLGTGTALAAPYYLLAVDHLSAYVYRNTFGELKDVWGLRLSGTEQALYYLTGEGGRLMFAHWLYLWLLLAGSALLAALVRRDRSAFQRVPAFVAVVIVSYGAVTLPAHKNPFLGVVLPGLLLFAAIEMMVYLARDRGGWRRSAFAGRCLLVAMLLVGLSMYRWPYQLTAGGPLTPEENLQHRRLLEIVYQDLRHTGGETTRVFFTQISAFLNPPLLEYRAGLDRIDGFRSHDLQLSRRPTTLDHELSLADHVIAFSAGNRNAMRWLPGSETQSEFLARLEADPEFSLAGIYGTPNGGEAYLFSRATGFRGIRTLAGLGPLEGPYPQWGLHSKVRWAMGPVTRFEVDLPVDARVRLTLETRADFPDQTMAIRVSGREIFQHRFSAPGVFERREILHDLSAGRHLVELEHSHWHDPGDQDDRPRAILMRTFTVLRYYESGVILKPLDESRNEPSDASIEPSGVKQ